MRSAVLEDCALCQETISSSELAAKAREGQFEGQQIHKQTHADFLFFFEMSASSFLLLSANIKLVTALLCVYCFSLALRRPS